MTLFYLTKPDSWIRRRLISTNIFVLFTALSCFVLVSSIATFMTLLVPHIHRRAKKDGGVFLPYQPKTKNVLGSNIQILTISNSTVVDVVRKRDNTTLTTASTEITQKSVTSDNSTINSKSGTYSSFSSMNVAPISKELPVNDTHVAFCICGTARTFQYDGVHENIMKRMIDPIRVTHITDVFFIVRVDDDAAAGRPIAPTEKDKFDEAVRSFNPVSITTYTDVTGLNKTRYFEKTLKSPVQMTSPEFCGFKKLKKLDFSHTLFRTKQCLQIVSEYERKQGFRYGWMYRVRTDVILIGKEPFITPPMMSHDALYVSLTPFLYSVFERWWKTRPSTDVVINGSIGDQIFAGSRLVAEVAFNANDMLDECESYELPVIGIEPALRMWLVRHNVNCYAMPWLWVIVRAYIGPICSLVGKLPIPDTSRHTREAECNSFWYDHASDLPGVHPSLRNKKMFPKG